jgi:hypothetical protein
VLDGRDVLEVLEVHVVCQGEILRKQTSYWPTGALRAARYSFDFGFSQFRDSRGQIS